MLRRFRLPSSSWSQSIRKMTQSAAPVQGRNFRLAMCQIAQPGDGSDKAANLAHARDMIAQAVKGGSEGKKPDLVMLPVSPLEVFCV